MKGHTLVQEEIKYIEKKIFKSHILYSQSANFKQTIKLVKKHPWVKWELFSLEKKCTHFTQRMLFDKFNTLLEIWPTGFYSKSLNLLQNQSSLGEEARYY